MHVQIAGKKDEIYTQASPKARAARKTGRPCFVTVPLD